MLATLFTPNSDRARWAWYVLAGWFVLFLGYWTLAKPLVFPSPLEVMQAVPGLWNGEGLGQEIITSFMVNLEALLLASMVSLPLAYLSRVPAFSPLAMVVSKLRFLSPATFFIVLLFLANGGHQIKVMMLAMGIAFFLTDEMVRTVQGISNDAFDDARTLQMSEWLATWYVVVRGTLHSAMDAIRGNAAMGWSMLIMVEGIVRSEGGVGVMLLNQEKHVNFAEVWAIAGAIVVVGILQDYVLGVLKGVVCPWTVPS
jgi:NitT/TauT family transport system permease protein